MSTQEQSKVQALAEAWAEFHSIVQRLGDSALSRGWLRETRFTLETVLVARFGPLPVPVRQAIAGAEIETLNAWIPRAATATTLTEVGIATERETE